jgi:hypothetical protein
MVGFDDILENIKKRDEDDIVGLNKRKTPPEKQGTPVPVEESTDEDEEHTIFGGYVKNTEEIIGAGIVGGLGIRVMNWLTGTVKK